MRDKWLRRLLIALEILVGLSTVRGGVSLLLTGGLGMPISFLENSPFPDYTIPALILLFIVGGTNLLAAVLVIRKQKYMLEASAIAGFGLLIWLVVEQYIIKHPHILQLIYFAIGISMLCIIMVLLKQNKEVK